MNKNFKQGSDEHTDSFKEEKMDACNDLEEMKHIAHKDVSERAERKKFLKKSGKSLWMKRKAMKTKALSIDISSRSTIDSSAYTSNIFKLSSTSLKPYVRN